MSRTRLRTLLASTGRGSRDAGGMLHRLEAERDMAGSLGIEGEAEGVTRSRY